eukprot:687443_1
MAQRISNSKDVERDELIICGYFRRLFHTDIPKDVYSLCFRFGCPVMEVLALITNATTGWRGFGFIDADTNTCTKFHCNTIYTPLCHIPNMTSFLQKNKHLVTDKQLNCILTIDGTALCGNQIGNKRLGSTTYERYPSLLFYDPLKLSNQNTVQTFDDVITSNSKSKFEFGMGSPIFCGLEHGIIYESTFNLYRLKLETIKRDKIKFTKMKSKNLSKVFGKFTVGQRTRHSLNMCYLDTKDKIFAIRHHFSARDMRKRRNPPTELKLFKIPCGMFDLQSNQWESCGNFVYKATAAMSLNFRASICFDNQNDIVYAFGYQPIILSYGYPNTYRHDIWVSSYHMKTKEWINLGEKANEMILQPWGTEYSPVLIKIDTFNHRIRCWCMGTNSIQSSYCDLGQKDLVWKDAQFVNFFSRRERASATKLN